MSKNQPIFSSTEEFVFTQSLRNLPSSPRGAGHLLTSFQSYTVLPPLAQILNRKILLGDTTGDTNVMGATQANTKGVGTFSWRRSRGSHFSPWGQLDPERDSLCLSGSQHTTQYQILSLPRPQTQSDTPNGDKRLRPLITEQLMCTDCHGTAETT